MNFLFRRVTPLASSMRPNARPLVAGSVRASASGPVQQQRPLHRLWKRVTDDDTGEGRRLLVLGFITGGVATALLFELRGEHRHSDDSARQLRGAWPGRVEERTKLTSAPMR